MSSSYETESSADLKAALKAVIKEILRLIDGFDYVEDGNLGVVNRIEAKRYRLVNYPQI
jgi:hypothetical protein